MLCVHLDSAGRTGPPARAGNVQYHVAWSRIPIVVALALWRCIIEISNVVLA